MNFISRSSPSLVKALFLLIALANPVQAELRQDERFIGSHTCATCHQQEFEQWQGSHHDLAMQAVTEDSVLGDFSNTRFTYAGTTSRFYRDGNRFLIDTDNATGELQTFEVKYVFGVYPLQQYLLELPGGRLHALSVSWDSRPAEQGGQRWFHLYPDEEITADDPLHWTGHYQNWNSRCAECHSTDLRKNYDSDSNSYSTDWVEINVGCETCHGPGAEHLKQAESGQWQDNYGFLVDLKQRGQWAFKPDQSIAENQIDNDHQKQIDSCGRCHARRGTLGEYAYGEELLETHRLSLIESPLYHSDGQILDEVYVYGSFLQSKMHQAGVVCTDCHNPHTARLKAEGNGICAQCHRADVYDSPEHHHHPMGSSGAECANCHMPETTYMVVDPRRDHSMRIPRPDLSVVMGTPNACTQCHKDRSDDWALNSLREWNVNFTDTGEHPARAMQLAMAGDNRSLPRLKAIAMDPTQTNIWRASAMVAMSQFPDQTSYETALSLLQSQDAILRLAATRSLEFLPPEQRFRVLLPRAIDPSRGVRMEAARLLAAVPLDQLDQASRGVLEKLFDEYLEVLGMDADMPGVQLQLGLFYAAQQQLTEAEQAYRQALAVNPQFLPALLNLADLYRVAGRDAEARTLLQEGIRIAPELGTAYHALGLLETRAGNQQRALEQLARAAGLEQDGVRHRYVYAIALHDAGQINAAIDNLKRLHQRYPDDLDILLALVNYCSEANRVDEAKYYARELQRRAGNNPQLQGMLNAILNRPS